MPLNYISVDIGIRKTNVFDFGVSNITASLNFYIGLFFLYYKMTFITIIKN